VRSVLATVLLFFSACFGFAQTKSAPSAADASYAGEAQIIEQSDTAYRYNADGTGTEDFHIQLKVQNEAGARQLSVLSFAYAAATMTAQFESVRVTHPDGTATNTPAMDAMDMPAPVTQQAPLYSDLKVLQLPVRGLRGGDTLEYRARMVFKTAEAPSQFWGSFNFLKTAVVLYQTLTLDVPADKYVQVWSPGENQTFTIKDGRRIYHWSGNQLKPTMSGKKTDDSPAAPEDNKPSVAWTTFHSWQEVGDWYRGLSAPRAVPTDALRAQADEITRDAKTPEEQVEALYSFVATRIRYVGIDFGIGRYEPHAAAEVLANRYGDCKDKDTLLEALLHAKGFSTAPALIGVKIDAVPDLPSPGLFNHVITTAMLPSGQVWMDSTPETAPFRLLISLIRDKQALVIPQAGAASLERTPAQPPFPFVDRFEATATLKADGELNGHVDINDRSDSEIVLRAIARNLAPAQWDQGTQYLANLLGFSGTTSNSTFARAEDLSVPMHLSYDYTRKPFGDWGTFRILPLFPVVELPEAPEKLPAAEIDLGAQRTEIAVSQIHLPADFSADLPDAVHVKTPFATFDKTYSLEGGALITKRTIMVLQSKLPANSWKDYKKFSDDVSLGQEDFIQLTTTSATAGSGPHPPKAGENNPVAAQLVSEVTELERNNDLSGAIKKLDEAKAIQPTEPFLWSNYGYIAMRQNKQDEAKKDVRRELELHPDESYVVIFYAKYLHYLKQDDEARSVLSASFKNDPSQEQVAMLLASIQAESNLPDAIATLRRAETASASSRNLPTTLASYLVRDHENAEAATILKKQLADADDPGTLNDASYLLAQTGTDLPFAEQKARQALDTLNTQSAGASISEANAQSFQRASLLVAAWDTLGYILAGENKLSDARGYIEAAWANRSSPDVGDHYGQLLEKLGKPGEALHIYQLAVSSGPAAPGSPELRDAKEAITRLEKAGTKPVANGTATSLQDERTFKLPLKTAHKAYVSATFRLQFAADAAPEVLRVSGDSSLDEASDGIRTLRLPPFVPAHSTARLLRDAVVTCSPGQKDCFFVLMPLGGINAEGVVN
jgi:predicted Zn-dependent protease